jgi:glutathione S-transferase
VFTAGDLLMVSVVRILEDDGYLDRYDNLRAYVARGTDRPACQRALADQLAGFTGAPPPEIAEWLAAREGAAA